jgi:hypothetical protein
MFHVIARQERAIQLELEQKMIPHAERAMEEDRDAGRGAIDQFGLLELELFALAAGHDDHGLVRHPLCRPFFFAFAAQLPIPTTGEMRI